MKAIIQRAYGPPERVLELGEVDQPEPKDDEVLVRVHASSVNIADWFTLIGKPRVIRASGCRIWSASWARAIPWTRYWP